MSATLFIVSLTLLAFVIGLFIGGVLKAQITINHVHKHVMDKPKEPVKQEEGYNASFGDPATKMYLDNQYAKRAGEE